MFASSGGPCIPERWTDEAREALATDGPSPLATTTATTATTTCEDADLLSQWERVLAQDAEAPAVMAEVLGMVGLHEVKASMMSQYRRIRLAQIQGDGAASSYNVRFDGNPGTGKTTLARHYGVFLE